MAKKFRKGRQIITLADLSFQLQLGMWIYYNHKPLHPNFFWNMSFATVVGAVRGRRIWLAEAKG